MTKFSRKKTLKEIRSWTEDTDRIDVPIAELKDLLKKSAPTDRDKCDIAGGSEELANWYFNIGTLRIEEGDIAGWLDIKLGMQFSFWSIRILVEQWEKYYAKNPDPRVMLRVAANCLSISLALAGSKETAWLGQRMERSLKDGAFGDWSYDCLPPFVLFLKQCAKKVDTKLFPLPRKNNPYEKIVSAWNDEKKLRTAIEQACDFHLSETKETDGYIGEFVEKPFDIIGFEFFALRTVRKSLGLQTPAVDHPLMEAPFAEVPEKIAEPKDDLLQRIIARVS